MTNNNNNVVIPETIGGKFAADFVRDTLSTLRGVDRKLATIAETFGLSAEWTHGDCATLAHDLVLAAYPTTDPTRLQGGYS